MSTFFPGITETIPSLFRGIFSEQNSAANPSTNRGSAVKKQKMETEIDQTCKKKG
jgi:hypothetical protein